MTVARLASRRHRFLPEDENARIEIAICAAYAMAGLPAIAHAHTGSPLHSGSTQIPVT
jgi:hypothetical protein